MRFERRLLVLSLAAAAPSLFTALALLWIADVPGEVRLAIALALVAASLFIIQLLHSRVTFPLRTLANVVGGLREEDYSLRARAGAPDDALGALAIEINRLADAMRESHLDALEAAALVRATFAQLDSAIFLFDRNARLQQTNRAGERLLQSNDLVGKTAEDLGLARCLDDQQGPFEMTFPGGTGRWSVRHSVFREKGRPHSLLVISDLSRVLRDEELLAWQRLARVLSHELNNSLASIQSIAGTLHQLVNAADPPGDWRDDASRGFSIIAQRVESLTRFTQAYARLARLPDPDRAPLEVEPIVRRVVSLGFAVPIEVEPGPPVVVLADADQIEQLLINIVQNAVDASLETGGGVTITWRVDDRFLLLSIIDEGLGVASTDNLFVPFFTTKPGGTGIGLVLSRQIAEAHSGGLSLRNHPRGGCEAILRLPRTV